MLEALHLSFVLPALIVLWEDVSCRCYVIVLSVAALHAEDVAPEVVLATQVPGARKMINLLVLIYSF